MHNCETQIVNMGDFCNILAGFCNISAQLSIQWLVNQMPFPSNCSPQKTSCLRRVVMEIHVPYVDINTQGQVMCYDLQSTNVSYANLANSYRDDM
jgi:hypothetical protein